MSDSPSEPYWNHNTYYYRWVLAQVPAGCRQAVDIGCGDAMLAGLLAERCAHVVGLEVSAEMVAAARRRVAAMDNVRIELADFLSRPADDDSVDLVTAVASLHHLPMGPALAEVKRILRPGGVLAVVGLARDRTAWDNLCGAAGLPVARLLDRRYGVGGPGFPVRDPELSWSQTRSTFAEALPGSVFRRRLLWRYTVSWRKPA